MTIPFSKYHGTGNDFIILDNRSGQFDSLTTEQISFMCHRHFGIGADGLMLFNSKTGFDFEMKYFNADGKEGSMCGNGGRCIVRYAIDQGLNQFTYRFWATDGLHEAEIDNHNRIRLKMKDVESIEDHSSFLIIDTGSPHFIKFAEDVMDIDVVETGRDIRNSKPYAENGVNVNFVENTGEDSIFVRTYERGVEDETLSCGTGVTAAALASAHNSRGFNRVEVHTPGGELSVEFNKNDDASFDNIWLCGPAEFVFKGEIVIK